jgi:hypothetical protein
MYLQTASQSLLLDSYVRIDYLIEHLVLSLAGPSKNSGKQYVSLDISLPFDRHF